MRKKIIHDLIKDIHGPREGCYEILKSSPLNEYLTGIIVSKDSVLNETREPDSESIRIEKGSAADDDFLEEEISTNIPYELNPQIKPSSFGISFTTNEENPSLEICVTWGRYYGDENENGKKIWKREPCHKIITDLNITDLENNPIVYEGDDGQIYLTMRKVKWKNYNHFTLSLVNDLSFDGDYISPESCIFQPSIKVLLTDNTKIIDPEYVENDDLSFIYREKPTKARGHMCSAVWKNIDYYNKKIFDNSIIWPDGIHFEKCSKFFESDLRTEFIPIFSMPSPDYDLKHTFSDYNKNNENIFSTSILSEIWDANDIKKYLEPIIIEYEKWINSQKEIEIDEKDKNLVDRLISNHEKVIKRIKNGISIIKTDLNAKLAFCFANKTIDLQYEWKQGSFSWRPFQLAFFLMCIESIFDNDSEYRDTLDLLWIPTGGGKTEAYMAIMAFTMALRRIRSFKNVNSEQTGAGTTIFSRYTLRLLTVQQFRRTLGMITAAEYLRVKINENGTVGWHPNKCNIKDSWIYGSVRFSVGMWVGGAVTPNHIGTKNDHDAISILKGKNGVGDPAQVISCPVCGNLLVIPEDGIPSDCHEICIVSKTIYSKKNLLKEARKIEKDSGDIEKIKIETENHEKDFMTVILHLNKKKNFTKHKIKEIWKQISFKLSIEEVSLNWDKIGYFGSIKKKNQRTEDDFLNFEIFCTNPKCCLNEDIIWNEGVPSYDKSTTQFPDGLIENKKLVDCFTKGSRIPIPALTVDEQIYSRCPTIVISTADKIARLAFESKTSNIFGNVEYYNNCYGYNRGNDLLPRSANAFCLENNIDVEPFMPPELIVQDELHLIDGPLGSMFGLYESIVEGLIKQSGITPKYIASTATIKNANSQVNLLYAKKKFQFPAYGLTISDSFFVKDTGFEESWLPKQKGKLFLGIYSPGSGPLYPLVKIWSKLLKTPFDNRKSNLDELKYFWTIVGYYNAIRELGGGIALYRDDIINHLNKLFKEDDEYRKIDQDQFIDLSSRNDSTTIPLILDKLEKDGNQIKPSFDAVFTTSMFGTGVDISHLSLMVVNGQPKTTGSYIQATGRIGRAYGGLVISFLRNGRPRDLSHYEMFMGYHNQIHKEVEPVSVSPFSKGTLKRAAGPASVSFLRNMKNNKIPWKTKDGNIICSENAEEDLEILYKLLNKRIDYIYKHMSNNNLKIKKDELIRYFKSELESWEYLAEKHDFKFNEFNPYREPENNVVLGDIPHKKYGKKIVYENAPQSLREIEETIGFRVKE